MITAPSELTAEFSTAAEEELLEGAQLFPNPVGDVLNISFTTAGPHEVVMLAADGRSIHTFRGTGRTMVIDAAGIADGIYLLNVTDGAERRTLRFTKHIYSRSQSCWPAARTV